MRKNRRYVRNRRLRRYIRNGLLTLSVIVAIVIYILSAIQLSLTNIHGLIAMLVSGGYILTFWYANDEVE